MAATKKKKVKQTAMLSCLARTKSVINSTTESIVPAYHVYAGFCQETTLHGMKHTVTPTVHCCERFLWVVLTLSAFFGAVYCAFNQWSRYNSEPVVVSLQRDYRNWWSAFPAVTGCFLERVDPEKAKTVIEEIWNVTEESDPERYEYYMGFIELVADVSFRINLQNFWKYQNDEAVKGVDLMELAVSVHPTMFLKVMVSDTVAQVYWTPVITEVGICMSFNSQYASFQDVMQDVGWRKQQLHRCHYLSAQCYVSIHSLERAVRYFIHSPYEISTAISNPTGEVAPGEELVIDFKAVEIQASDGVRKLRPEQRRCRYPDEWISNSVRAYSFNLCQMHCRNRMALLFCGCRPYFFAKGASLGGTTALFVGASVLSVVETALFIIRQIVRICVLRQPYKKINKIVEFKL